MHQGWAEKALTIGYSILIGLGAISSITCGIAWSHWKETLDKCGFYRNCTCLLYASNSPTVFYGSRGAACIWVTYGPIPYVLLCVVYACFHGFRVFFSTKQVVTKTVTAKNDLGEVIELHAVQGESTGPLPRLFWISSAVVSALLTVYTLIHFSIYIDGYLSTCRQYRYVLEKQLQSLGTLIPLIDRRLSCSAVFDFMDYMQVDSGVAYRGGHINTGADLAIGISASFFSWVTYGFVTYINVKFAMIKE